MPSSTKKTSADQQRNSEASTDGAWTTAAKEETTSSNQEPTMAANADENKQKSTCVESLITPKPTSEEGKAVQTECTPASVTAACDIEAKGRLLTEDGNLPTEAKEKTSKEPTTTSQDEEDQEEASGESPEQQSEDSLPRSSADVKMTAAEELSSKRKHNTAENAEAPDAKAVKVEE